MIDLKQLVPEKYRVKPVFSTLFDELQVLIEQWFTDIAGLHDLRDPYSVPDAYLQNLADNIGLVLTSEDTATAAQRRKELLNAIDWFKLRGTYLSLDVLALMTNFTFVMYDMYTADYVTFIDEEWFVGDENENPSGLSASYYKSPHFGLSVLLDRTYPAGVYTEGSLGIHLWRPSLFAGVSSFIERTRPVNTVPHYLLTHQCTTDESGDAYIITNTGTVTKVTTSWIYSNIFFDGASLGSGEQVDFDEADFFDSDFEAFIASITIWKLSTSTGGSGASGGMDLTQPPPVGGYVLTDIVLSGTIDRYTIYDDRIVFEFNVGQAVVQDDINEMGLFIAGVPTDDMVIASTFYDIHKDGQTDLKVIVTVNRRLG